MATELVSTVDRMNWFSNFGMSEWLIACAAVLFVIVLIDGFRRMRAERHQDLKWDLQLAKDFPEDEDPLDNEMIESGYRVVNRGGAAGNPEQAHTMGGFNAHSEYQAPAGESEAQAKNASVEQHQPASGETDVEGAAQERTFASKDISIISLHVKSASQEGFLGSDLVQVLLACNMRYGETNILHRYADPSKNSGPVDFSVANMLEPGIFDLENLSGFRTPGITLFMALPGPSDPLAVFRMMLETANCVAQNLNGILLDDEHSTATPQVLNHYQDRIRQIVVQSERAGQRADSQFATLPE